MPILTGVIASGISGNLASPLVIPGGYDALSTVTVGSTALSSITFSGLPTTGYKHLQIRGFFRNNANSGGGAEENLRMRFDGSAGDIYTSHAMIGNGGGSMSFWSFNSSEDNDILLSYGTIPMSNSAANIFGSQIIDILDYGSNSKFKSVKSLGGVDRNGGGYSNFSSGSWRSLDPIDTITLFPQAGAFVQHSHFALYGVR
jgi:hypothetical protein